MTDKRLPHNAEDAGTLKKLLQRILDRIAIVSIASFGLLVVSYALLYICVNVPEPASAMAASSPWITDLLGFLISLSSALLSACLVAVVVDGYKDAMLGKQREIDAEQILDIVFNSNNAHYRQLGENVLRNHASKALAAAYGIKEGSVESNLLGVCLDELRGKVNGLYADDLHLSRTYKVDTENPEAVFVSETMTYCLVNNSSTEQRRPPWRRMRSAAIAGDDASGRFGKMVSKVTTVHGALTDVDDSVVRCESKGGSRVFNNPHEPLTIPANCNGMTLIIKREFYIPLSEMNSSYEWTIPVRRLMYEAAFENGAAVFTTAISGCMKCGGARSCKSCEKNVVDMSQQGTSRTVVRTHDWIGSGTSLLTSWSFPAN